VEWHQSISSKTLFIALALGLGLTMIALWLMGAQISSAGAAPEPERVQVYTAPDAEFHVCPSGPPTCPYSSIQAAVDAASDGDLIKVAKGTYTGVSTRQGNTQMVYISKTVTLQGGYITSNWMTPKPEVNLTTLDAKGQGRVLYVEGGYWGATIIAGLHITGGNAIGQGSNQNGGGVYCSRGYGLTLTNNHIFGNTAQAGGGVYMDRGANATLSGNTISSNTSEESGGGIVLYNGGYILTDNVITANTADQGGGLVAQYSHVTLHGNTFSANTAHAGGGGVFVFKSAVELGANTFVSNTAQRGGGLAIFGSWGGDSLLVNTVIADNQASLEGTGIYISGVPIHLWHTTLARNSGGDGSGVAIGNWNPWSESGVSTVDLRNTILASQNVGMNVTDGSTISVDSILWYNTPITVSHVPEAVVMVENQITGDPDFVDPAGGDYHIGAASAAHDAGIEAGVTTDIDSQVRPMGFGYDLGADEFGEAALSLVKGPSLVGANVGGEVTYSIVITNSGTQDASGVVLTDTLDAWQRAAHVESPEGNCTTTDGGWGGRVVCNPGALNVGDSITILLSAEISAAAPLGQAMTNTVLASANETMNSTRQAIVYAQACHVRIGDEATEYTSVQAAVEAATPGALVKVAGSCMGVSGRPGARQQVYLDKSLTIQGGYITSNWTTPNPEVNLTTLDARGQGRVFYIIQSDKIVIGGLHITGGDAYWQTEGAMGGAGGGAFCWGSEFTLTNNHIFGNTAKSGGGMYTGFCSGNLIGNTFTANSTPGGGGGGVALHASGGAPVNVAENVFDSNSANEGGGLWVDNSSTRINKNIFIGNTARIGGGLALYLGGPTNLDGSVGTESLLNENIIVSNTAERGGGLAITDDGSGSATLTNTVIADNQASVEGAGVFITSAPSVHLLQTTLARNGGGDGSGVTLGWYDWQGTGASTVVMTNTILANQSAGLRVSGGNTVTVNGILWYATPITVSQSLTATVVVQNQHTGNPAFVNPAGGDYHIGAVSAARDAGVDSGVTRDMDGQSRPMGLGWDIGADEYFEMFMRYLPLVLRR
jgi:hypothetical protein